MKKVSLVILFLFSLVLLSCKLVDNNSQKNITIKKSDLQVVYPSKNASISGAADSW